MQFINWSLFVGLQAALGFTTEQMLLFLFIAVFGSLAGLASIVGYGDLKGGGSGSVGMNSSELGAYEDSTTDWSKGQVRTGELMGKPFSPFD